MTEKLQKKLTSVKRDYVFLVFFAGFALGTLVFNFELSRTWLGFLIFGGGCTGFGATLAWNLNKPRWLDKLF